MKQSLLGFVLGSTITALAYLTSLHCPYFQ